MTRIAPEQMCENAKSALTRNLPLVKVCKPHKAELSIVGGGPSLAETYKDLTGYIGAVNGSLAYLIDRGVLPDACAVVDPGPQMADIVVADDRVRYFIASVCHPSLFDKLKDCHVELWHPSGQPGLDDVLPKDALQIGGGCTMGLRWLSLGYVCGFRSFHMHGMDSSFREDGTHAYPDTTERDMMLVSGRKTSPAFLAQVNDFFEMLHVLKRDAEPIKVDVYGDGLLQDRWRSRVR